MNKIITPLSFLNVDGKLEGSFPMLMTVPAHPELSGAVCYEEIVVWPHKISEDTDATRTNLKTRVRLV